MATNTTKRNIRIDWQKVETEILNAEHTALTLWIQVYQDFAKSGYDEVKEYAETLAKRGEHFGPATIRQNLSHIAWAEDNLIGGAKSAKTLNHIRATRYPNKAKSTKSAKARDITKEAMKFSIAELEAMLAFRKSVKK